MADWSSLPDGEQLQRRLQEDEEAGEYTKYVAGVEALLQATLRATLPDDLVERLWRQLVVTCNAFAIRCIDQKKHATALELLGRATTLAENEEVMSRAGTMELKAFIADTNAFYYYRRNKAEAALAYVQKAMRTHVHLKDWSHVAKCHLHTGCILSKLNRHDEAIRCLAQVLSMVESGELEVGGTQPQKLCLVAVGTLKHKADSPLAPYKLAI